jgi:hypothetical protein
MQQQEGNGVLSSWNKIWTFLLILLLPVLAQAQLPWTDDFETGTLVPPWTSNSTYVVNSAVLPHAGLRSVEIPYDICRITGTQAAPTLSETPCAGAGGNRFVEYTYHNGLDRAQSAEASKVVSAGQCLKVTSPAAQTGLRFWNVWVSTTSGDETNHKQNATPVAIGTDWTEPATGLIAGSALTLNACSTVSQDINRRAIVDLGAAYNNIHVRGYVYFQTPTGGGATDHVQRKLMYLWHSPGVGTWEPILNSYWTGTHPVSLAMAQNLDVAHCGGGSAWTHWDLAQLHFDTWYAIEIEIILGDSSGLNVDGYRLWVDGVEVNYGGKDNLHVTFRGTCVNGIQSLYLGAQSNTGNPYAVEEKRYWDDVVISTSYIGVIPDNPVDPSALLGSAGEVFAAQKVGTTSAAKLVMLQSTGAGPLTIASIAVSGDFARTHDCPISPATLASGLYCTISLTVTPTVGGALAGTLTVTDDAPDSPQTAALSGTGLVPVTVSGGATLSGGATIQ